MQANPKQQQAIDKINGPLLIIAGAGSGKTATLTARVEYMIREKSIAPNEIMMVTFTNKAASEMRERVARVLGVETPRNLYARIRFPLVGTFHSIGIFILKEVLSSSFAEELARVIGLRKDFVIYDEQDKISVLKAIIKEKLGLDEKEFPAKKVAFYISNAKNNLVTPAMYQSQVDSNIKEIVAKVYEAYAKQMAENNAIDFDDILTKTLEVFRIPQILEHYQERYKYLMVDEYQDTNKPQYEIVKLLAKKYKNLAVVGDDAQSIYSWRGADMTNIINFKKDYPEALEVKLEQNYRSTKSIIAGANSVIKNNNFGIKKELWTDNDNGEKIQIIEAPDDKSEARIIASIIEDGKKDAGNYGDNLILYRMNAQSRQIEEALLSKNIPYKVVGGLKFYDRKEIKDLIAYLKLIYNPDDVVSLKRVINTPTRKIGAKSVSVLDSYKNDFGLPYFSILENIDEVAELNSGAKNALMHFFELIMHLKAQSQKLSVEKLIEEIVKLTNYEDYIGKGLSTEEKDSKLQNIDELKNLASEYEGLEPAESLATFLEEIALLTDMDMKNPESDFVTLMTIHTSKGLEQKRVFVVGLEENIFPSSRSLADAKTLEEERRLMYVAMTRAENELYLSVAKERFHFGDYIRNPESRFLKEIEAEQVSYYDLSEYLANSGDSYFSATSKGLYDFKSLGNPNHKLVKKVANNDISQFAVGDKVSHHKFGNGIITAMSGEVASIAFTGKGIKKMNIKIAPVKKI